MADPTDSGIYEIVNLANGKRYIGSAQNFKLRWRLHRIHLRRGTHHSRHLQSSWTKRGEDSFEFRVLLTCERADLIEAEQAALDALAPEYNNSRIAGSCAGVKHQPRTPEHRRNISQASKAAWERRRESGDVSRYFTDAHKANIQKAAVASWERLKASGFKSPPKTAEHRAAISAAFHKRVAEGWSRPPFSEAHRSGISDAIKTSWENPDHRTKRAAAIKADWEKRKREGYRHPPLTEEQRAKHRAGAKAAWERRKAARS